MPAKRIVSDIQWEILLKYMQAHPDMAKGSATNEGLLVKRKTHEQWEMLATQLNQVGQGATKTREKWRDYWNSVKFITRKKSLKRRQYQQAKEWRNGPMHRKLAVLTQREEVILGLIGKTAYGEQVDETQTTKPILSRQSPRNSTVTSDYSLPTLQSENPAGQAPPLLPNSSSSSPIGSPQATAASNSTTSDVTAQEQTRKVAIVDANMSRISLENLNSIKNQLQKKLWNHMIDKNTASRPTFKYCSVLEPFGLIFKCCNLDAVEWLTLTTEDGTFAGHNLVVILDDLENKLPKTVDLYVNMTTDFEHDSIESVFNVLVRTNQCWLNTPQWKLVPYKCVSVTSPSDATRLCVVFSVLLSDLRRLRREGFKLHFLFGVVPVDYYEEAELEVIESQKDK